jgi:hypothetical protein
VDFLRDLRRFRQAPWRLAGLGWRRGKTCCASWTRQDRQSNRGVRRTIWRDSGSKKKRGAFRSAKVAAPRLLPCPYPAPLPTRRRVVPGASEINGHPTTWDIVGTTYPRFWEVLELSRTVRVFLRLASCPSLTSFLRCSADLWIGLRIVASESATTCTVLHRLPRNAVPHIEYHRLKQSPLSIRVSAGSVSSRPFTFFETY